MFILGPTRRTSQAQCQDKAHAEKLGWHEIVVVVQHLLEYTHAFLFTVCLLVGVHILGRRQLLQQHVKATERERERESERLRLSANRLRATEGSAAFCRGLQCAGEDN